MKPVGSLVASRAGEREPGEFPWTKRRMYETGRLGSLLALLCALAANGGALGDAGTFSVDADRTSARFSVQYLGFAMEQGRFGRTSGTIVADADRKVDTIDLVIDTRSVATGWDLRDAFLRSELMFDAARFPQLRFHSTRLRYDGARLVGVEGEVTLRGVTRPVRLDVGRVECLAESADGRQACGATVRGRISRSAFGMDFAYPLIGDEVELDFTLTAFRVGDARAVRTP